jgi:hypothetical protein
MTLSRAYNVKFEDFQLDPEFSQDTINIYRSFFKEIWEDNEYERFGISVEPGDIVVDCGGSIGLFAKFASERGASRVYSFEVRPELYKYLDLNTKNDLKITAVNGFIGDSEGDNHYDLKKIMNTFELDKIDFLKIDIEGTEFSFIQNTSPKTFEKIHKISMEVHVWGMFPMIFEHQIAASSGQSFLKLIEKLNLCGYKVSIQNIHPNSCLYMLYASR